jgi:hypothetical protein
VTQPVDSGILHEIVRVVEAKRKVPDRVTLRGREYQITYLEDHQRRLEEALQRYDKDRLNMLYGQLASKVKYQALRRVPSRPTPEPKPAKAREVAPPAAKAAKPVRPPAKAKPAAKKVAKPATKPAPAKKAAAAKRKATAKKAAPKRIKKRAAAKK